MKLRITSIVSFLLILALFAVGCAGSNVNSEQTGAGSKVRNGTVSDNKNDTDTTDNNTGIAKDNTVTAADNNGKALVVYYSATGSTKKVADVIAETISADTFEIIPADKYSSEDLDWTNVNSRVNKEHDDESLRNVDLVSVKPDNWEDYQTVYICYPIWWQIAAWPVNTFVKNNDFTGKTVIPVCTSMSSGIGQSGQLLSQLAGTGKWLEGQRFSSSVSEEDVKDWVTSLN